LIVEHVEYKGADLTPEQEEALYQLGFQSDLQKKLADQIGALGRGNVPRIYLYDLRADGGNDVPVEVRVRKFAQSVAPELRRLLIRPSVRTIGVAWGSNIAATTEGLLSQQKARMRTKDPVTVVALCGGSLDDVPTSESSSAIAEVLSLALNQTRRYAKTLGITPAYLPASEIRGAELIWRYIVSNKPYLDVFGVERIPEEARPSITLPEGPLCEVLDAFLTSVSIEGGTLGYGGKRIYRADFIDPADIEAVVYGDMGGIPLPRPRPRLSDDQLKILKNIEESWMGVTRQHIEKCVERGFDRTRHATARPPGCILIAVGAQKARTTYQAVVREGLVNHLFIDYECAQALSALLEHDPDQ
jgi:hypothetical protein